MDALPEPSSGRQLRVLLVEDSRSDAELTEWRLRQGGYACTCECVANEADMRRALRAALPDLILSDFSLPGFDGMTALAIARAEAPDVPFIFLSGTIGEERAIEALRCGAIDYVLKSNPKRLVPAVQRALDEATLRRRNQAAERHMARLAVVLQTLSAINSALVRIQNRDEAIAETCRLAQGVGGYQLAMVALINPETRMARPIGWAGYDFLEQPGREFPVAVHESGDTTFMGRVIRTGESLLCSDIATFPHVIHSREALLAAGIRSLACLALRVDNTPVGALLLGTRAPTEIVQDEWLLLEELGSNLSFALQYLDKQNAVHFLSYFEPLTGLAKRSLFCERLTRLQSRHGGTPPRLAVMVFDVAHLRVVNDSFGRHTGDRLLQSVADRLKSRFADTEHVAHLGGGTFACVSGLTEPGAGEVRALHDELMRLFAEPFSVDGREIAAEIKSGVACYPEDGIEPHALVQNAEAALKEAKSSGERYLHHRVEMNADLARRVEMEQRLRVALETNQFVLYYQPKIALSSGRVAGVEALLRWQDPGSGVVAPAIFLPMLESAGLMAATGAWVLRQAARDCRAWRSRGLPPIRVAVNMSPAELRRSKIADEIIEAVGDLAREPEWGIDLEITEGALSGDTFSCVHALRLLRAAGMRIAIDDFGTGFSSLGRLSELPIDTLKIDRSFTQRLPYDLRSGTLVATVIGLAHAFGMTTVAEGVETAGQLEYLQREGCDESQGYLHARPLPRTEFERWLEGYNGDGGYRPDDSEVGDTHGSAHA